MPKGLVRYQKGGVFHFLTSSCYRRLALLDNNRAYQIFETELEKVRRRYRFVVAGYVLMPEHVHLLVSEPKFSMLSVALQVLKQETSKKLKQPGTAQFWQRRYYDLNVWTEKKRVEKLRYTATRFGADWRRSRKTGRGLVTGITLPERWDRLRLSRNGRRETVSWLVSRLRLRKTG